MIFINDLQQNYILIPRNYRYFVTNLEFKIINRFTNKTYIYNEVEYESTDICFELKNINLSNLPTGEYEYVLTDKNRNIIVSQGLIQLGERDKNINMQYNGNQQYIEYKG